jgi:hypothetical protein
LFAEYRYRVAHIPGRTNPADFLASKRFRVKGGQGPAERSRYAVYADPDFEVELVTAAAPAPETAFVHVGQRPDTPWYLHTDFAEAVRVALPADPVLGPTMIAAAVQAEPPGRIIESWRRCLVLRDGLLYRRSRRGDRLCAARC